MGKELKRVIAIHAFFIGAFMLAHPDHPAFASEKGKDVSKEISELRNTVSSAELFLAPPNATFRADLKAPDVIRMSCHYKATSPDDVSSLIDLIANARVIEASSDKDGYDARVVVRLYDGDSKHSTLIMSPDYSNAPANGGYLAMSKGGNQEIPVVANTGIEKELRFWASQHQSLTNKPCPH